MSSSVTARIYARSPFIVSINEEGQVSGKVEIYLSNTINTIPASPQYTLSKPIPSSNLTEITFDISPYCREFISNSSPQPSLTNTAPLDNYEYCYYEVFAYYDLGEGYLLGTFYKGVATNGYNSFEDYANADNAIAGVYANSGVYYYYPDSNTIGRIGHIGIHKYNGTSPVTSAVYTDLIEGVITTVDLSTSSSNPSQFRVIPKVLSGNYFSGNILELKNGSTVLKTFTFKPILECKYTPVKIDYIDKFGMWNFLWFFKSSNENISTNSKQYNIKQTSWNYDPIYGVSKIFNKTGRKTFTLNTGWMEEDSNFQIEELMLSERVLIDGKPAILKTDKTELFKHLNNKQFSYQMEFEVAYDLIQNVK